MAKGVMNELFPTHAKNSAKNSLRNPTIDALFIFVLSINVRVKMFIQIHSFEPIPSSQNVQSVQPVYFLP